MTREDRIRAIDAALHRAILNGELPADLDLNQVAADLALADDVRELDRACTTHHTDRMADDSASCYCNHPEWVADKRFAGGTPDEARAKAATYVRQRAGQRSK